MRPTVSRSVGWVGLVGLFASAAVSTMSGCQPGTLDCDAVTCPGPVQVKPDGGSPPAPKPDGAATGPDVRTDNVDSSSAAVVSANTLVPGCNAYPTLGKMDMLFAAKCATGACHGIPALLDLKAPDVWKRLLDLKTTFSCSGDKVIDGTDPTKSVLATRSATPPKCGGTGTATAMPPAGSTPLTADEIACLDAFVKAAAGK